MSITRQGLNSLLNALVIASAVATVGEQAVAADGRIPIFKAITIASSGSYVLTRDLDLPPGNFITVVGPVSVTIDFAGHSITGGPDSRVIATQMEGLETACGSVRVRDGRIVGAWPLLPPSLARCPW